MDNAEHARRTAIRYVESASARAWPNKLLHAWGDALRRYHPDEVDRACRQAVATWNDTLLMPVARVIELIRAERRANTTRHGDPAATRCPDGAPCAGSWEEDLIPGHTTCHAHNVSWPKWRAA